MSRPPRTRKSPAERSAEILEASITLARDEGLIALTQRAIAARAQVAPTLVTHYAPSMDALVASTFTAIVDSEVEEITRILPREPSAALRLLRLIDVLCHPTREEVTSIWVDAWSLGRRNAALAEAIRTATVSWHRLIADTISFGVEQNEFKASDPDAVAWLILGLTDGLNAHALVGASDPETHVALLTRALERELNTRLPPQ